MTSKSINQYDLEQKCLSELKSCIKENPDLLKKISSSVVDDRFLLHFVRGKKCDSKQAYSTLENYIKVRTETYPILFQTLRPSTNPAFKQKIIRKLKYPDDKNRVVAINRTGYWNTEEASIENVFQHVISFLEEGWNSEDVEQDGFVLINDLSRYNMNHLKAFRPAHARQIFNIVLNGFPLKVKGIHIVNEIYLFTLFLKTIRTLLPKKMRERFYVHSANYESLHEYVSPDILPESLGGNLSEEQAYDSEFEERVSQKDSFYANFFNF